MSSLGSYDVQKHKEQALELAQDEKLKDSLSVIEELLNNGLPTTKEGMRRLLDALRFLEVVCGEAANLIRPLLFSMEDTAVVFSLDQ